MKMKECTKLCEYRQVPNRHQPPVNWFVGVHGERVQLSGWGKDFHGEESETGLERVSNTRLMSVTT